MKVLILLVLLQLYLAQTIHAQSAGSKHLSDTTRLGKDFTTTINNLKGFEYRNIFQVPFGLTNDGAIVISNRPDFDIVIDIYKKDSIHVYFLIKPVSIDSTKPGSKPAIYKIFDVLILTFDESKIRIADRYCECNDQKDNSIIALARDTYTQYLDDILRAWKINKKLYSFEEISPKGISCLNMGYGD